MPDPVAPRAPVQVAPAKTPALESLLTLSVFVVIVAALFLAREVLIPITVAILLSFVLAPVVNLLRRIHLPRVVAVLLAVMFGVGVILAVGSVIGVQIAGLSADVPRYAATVQDKVAAVRGATMGRLTSLMNVMNRQATKESATSTSPASVASSGPVSAVHPGPVAASPELPVNGGPKPVPVEIDQPTSPWDVARSLIAPVLQPVSDTLIIIIIAVFILLQRDDLRDRMIRLFGSSDLHRTTAALDDAGRRLGRYFLAQLGINATFGIIVAIGLMLIGVPSPALWGVVAALLRFVPYIGAVIAGLLPAALAAAVDPGWSMVLWTLGLFVVVESITGQIIEPLIYGHSTGLSPAAVIIAAIFWTWLWGPIGLVLSTPLTLCLVVLGRHVDRLEFLEVMLGDRPALTPVENFYQRMLANDPDETLQQAEQLLKDRPLTAYYDEVALKGLQLAVNDEARGVLDPDKVERIMLNVRSLINDLSDVEDRNPTPSEKADASAVASQAERALPSPSAPENVVPEQLAPHWQGPSPILCLAGRGSLDEAASTMLAQLLEKHGLGAHAVSHDAASREKIGSLDLAGVAMICVNYLETSSSSSNLHYLVKRLRKRAPKMPILVGVWPGGDDAAPDKRVRDVVGADYYTSSLKQAVETCLAVAHDPDGVVPDQPAKVLAQTFRSEPMNLRLV